MPLGGADRPSEATMPLSFAPGRAVPVDFGAGPVPSDDGVRYDARNSTPSVRQATRESVPNQSAPFIASNASSSERSPTPTAFHFDDS